MRRPLHLADRGAITAVNTLFYAVGHWNAFFNAFIYLNDGRLFRCGVMIGSIKG